MPTTTTTPDNLKRFLDETADNLSNLKTLEVEELYENLIQTVLEQDSVEIIEEIFAFCSASVPEMIQSARPSLLKIFKQRNALKYYSNFHVLISSVVSTIVKSPVSDFEITWIDFLLEAVISGLTAIESETISLSGSSLIKLLKWQDCGERISKILADHPDFVAILTADMCAMFSRIEEVDSAPFLRIVRFCELLIDVSDKKSELENKIVASVSTEFIAKVYRTTLRTMANKNSAFKWSNSLLKVCHRGNELVKPLVGEVFKGLLRELVDSSSDDNSPVDNSLVDNDFIEILENERSRNITEIVQLLFSSETPQICSFVVNDQSSGDSVTEEMYKEALLRQFESLERFKVKCSYSSISLFGMSVFRSHRTVLLNWLPYVLKVTEIETNDAVLRMNMDISKKLIKFLEL